MTADSIVGEVISTGTISAGVTTNQTIDLSTGRFFEVFINADVTLNFTNPQNGTLKRITIVTQTADIRQITFQIDGASQGTRPIGDGSTTNSKQLYELYSFETQKYIAEYDIVS